MTDIELLKGALSQFAQLDEDDFNLSLPCWKIKSYKKGEIYNPMGSICRYLGFTMEGYFRSYLYGKNGEEVNLFLFPLTMSWLLTRVLFIKALANIIPWQ